MDACGPHHFIHKRLPGFLHAERHTKVQVELFLTSCSFKQLRLNCATTPEDLNFLALIGVDIE